MYDSISIGILAASRVAIDWNTAWSAGVGTALGGTLAIWFSSKQAKQTRLHDARVRQFLKLVELRDEAKKLVGAYRVGALNPVTKSPQMAQLKISDSAKEFALFSVELLKLLNEIDLYVVDSDVQEHMVYIRKLKSNSSAAMDYFTNPQDYFPDGEKAAPEDWAIRIESEIGKLPQIAKQCMNDEFAPNWFSKTRKSIVKRLRRKGKHI